MSLRKYYFVVVQLAIEIYSLPVSTANGIKFRFQFIKMSDRDLKFVYLFCQTDKCKHPFGKLVGTSTLALQLPVQSVFITTNNISAKSCQSVLLVEETRLPGENL
jgi:hypothetical protein